MSTVLHWAAVVAYIWLVASIVTAIGVSTFLTLRKRGQHRLDDVPPVLPAHPSQEEFLPTWFQNVADTQVIDRDAWDKAVDEALEQAEPTPSLRRVR